LLPAPVRRRSNSPASVAAGILPGDGLRRCASGVAVIRNGAANFFAALGRVEATDIAVPLAKQRTGSR